MGALTLGEATFLRLGLTVILHKTRPFPCYRARYGVVLLFRLLAQVDLLFPSEMCVLYSVLFQVSSEIKQCGKISAFVMPLYFRNLKTAK